jgi:hypothetical protein
VRKISARHEVLCHIFEAWHDKQGMPHASVGPIPIAA